MNRCRRARPGGPAARAGGGRRRARRRGRAGRRGRLRGGARAAPGRAPSRGHRRAPRRPPGGRGPRGRPVAGQRKSAAATCDPAASSLAPLGPPQVTPGSYMATISARGYLIAGVDQSTYHFGYLNPLDGHIEGFDIDMIRAVAQAIFGNPDKVQYKAITDAERIPDIPNGSVDIVAHTMTITCDRLQQVDFSSVYFDAHQRVLIPDNSTRDRRPGRPRRPEGVRDQRLRLGDHHRGLPVAPEGRPGPVLDRLPGPAAAGPGGGGLHRRLDPVRARRRRTPSPRSWAPS